MANFDNYYDDGEYFVFSLKDATFEVVIYVMKSKRNKALAKEKLKVSSQTKNFLREMCGSSKIKLIRDECDRMWMQVGRPQPSLCNFDTSYTSHKIHYFRINSWHCKKDHTHSSDCVTVDCPVFKKKDTQEKSSKRSP